MKQTLISQDLDFQKSRCRLNGRLFEQQFMYVFMPNSISLGNMTNLKIYQILFQYLFTSWTFAMDYPVVHYYTLHCSLFVSFPGLCEKRTFSWCTVNPHQSLFPLCSHFINVPRPSMYQQVKVNKKVAYGNIISKRAESPLSVHHHWLDVVIGPVHSGTTSRKTSQKQGWKSQTWKWFT